MYTPPKSGAVRVRYTPGESGSARVSGHPDATGPLLVLLAAVGVGVSGGLLLRPAPVVALTPAQEPAADGLEAALKF